MKANYKQLKVVLAFEVKKINSTFLVLKLGKCLFFDNFFSNLNKF